MKINKMKKQILRSKKFPLGRRFRRQVSMWLLIHLLGGGGTFSCSNWLDVMPENVATIDMIFRLRQEALNYLCSSVYSFLGHTDTQTIYVNPGLLASDELYGVAVPFCNFSTYAQDPISFKEGMLSSSNELFGSWGVMYQGLRVCNTFLENVHKVPDLQPWERDKWIAETKVLKAYFHFILIRKFGPIPLARNNISVNADVATVQVARDPVDDCFQYIVQLLDEACAGDMLPDYITDPASEMGRITKTIAKALKAKVLVFAASPLFNGNQVNLLNHDGTPLFNANYDPQKWQRAADACREAINASHEIGHSLYTIGYSDNDTINTDVTLRNAFTQKWNSDIVFASSQSYAYENSDWGLIFMAMPKLNPSFRNSIHAKFLNVPLHMAHLFYTNHGVPVEEDNTRNMRDLYELRTAQWADRLYIREGKISLDLHFDREPRFYAWVGFDGGIWFGAGEYNYSNPSTLWHLALKKGETDGSDGNGNWTGYIPKKYIPYEAQVINESTISTIPYAWPIIRLSDLYLLYAEAINEVEGPTGPNSVEMFTYIDRVRARAGLKGVKESWDTYSNNPNKFKTKEGMRQIIQQERMIELSFEGHRFWDIRRWKIARDIYNSTPLEGWNTQVSIDDGTETEINRMMYTKQLLLNQKFGVRDYFWPIYKSEIEKNHNLVQNIEW